METLDDLVARERRGDATALTVAEGPTYDYRRFCTTAWKTGNFLRHQGVRDGVVVGVADDLTTQPLLTLFGTALLGGATRFGEVDPAEVQALVLPAAAADAAEVPAGTHRVGYGAEPEDPAVAHFGRDVWSENPSFPPVERDPETPALATADATYSHRELVGAAERVVDEYDVTADDRVAVRASLTRPGTVVAGVLAPLVAGGAVALDAPDGTEADATLAVESDASSETAGVRSIPADEARPRYSRN